VIHQWWWEIIIFCGEVCIKASEIELSKKCFSERVIYKHDNTKHKMVLKWNASLYIQNVCKISNQLHHLVSEYNMIQWYSFIYITQQLKMFMYVCNRLQFVHLLLHVGQWVISHFLVMSCPSMLALFIAVTSQIPFHSSWMFKTSVLWTKCLRFPHKINTWDIISGEHFGHRVGPSPPIHHPGKWILRASVVEPCISWISWNTNPSSIQHIQITFELHDFFSKTERSKCMITHETEPRINSGAFVLILWTTTSRIMSVHHPWNMEGWICLGTRHIGYSSPPPPPPPPSSSSSAPPPPPPPQVWSRTFEAYDTCLGMSSFSSTCTNCTF